MTQEDLEKKSRIDFPEPLVQGGIKNLLNHLVKNIPGCSINYTVDKRGVISRPNGTFIYDREHSHGFSGYIAITSPNCSGTVPFRCYVQEPEKEENQDLCLFQGVKMEVSGFSHIAQVPKEYLEAMDLIRQKTQEFFESRKE
jgi:hypothetical protein